MAGAALTVQVKLCVPCWLLASVTATVKVGAPAVVGVPVSAPVEAFRAMPAGSAPAETDQV